MKLGLTSRLIKALVTYDRWTRAELGTAANVSRHVIDKIVNELHEAGVVHVDGWLDDAMGRQSVAVFTLGPGKDAKKRTALTGRQRTAAYVERKKLKAQVDLQQLMAGWTARKEVSDETT